MVGGNQRISRKEHFRNLLGREVLLDIFHLIEDGERRIREPTILEYREPDKGYFIKGTDLQVYLNRSNIDSKPGFPPVVYMNLNGLPMDLEQYTEAMERISYRMRLVSEKNEAEKLHGAQKQWH